MPQRATLFELCVDQHSSRAAKSIPGLAIGLGNCWTERALVRSSAPIMLLGLKHRNWYNELGHVTCRRLISLMKEAP